MNLRRILALLGVILLFGLYAAAFLLAVFNHPDSGRMFLVAVVSTIAVPILIHLLLMMRNARRGKGFLDETYTYREKPEDRDS